MNPVIDSIRSFLRHKWMVGSVIAILAALLSLVLGKIAVFENLEFITYDMRFKIRGAQDTAEDKIAIVGIDAQSFVALKARWPFPRSYLARIIENLMSAGARMVVVDIELSAPDVARPRADSVFAAILARHRNVLLAGKIETQLLPDDSVYPYAIPPTELFVRSATPWGLFNIDDDPDSFIRRYLVYGDAQNQRFYTLATLAYAILNGLTDRPGEFVKSLPGSFSLGDLSIPKIDARSFLINFRGPTATFETYSLSSIIDDERFTLPLEDDDTDAFEYHKETGTFQDKVVFIGATAEELQDTKFAPFFSYQGRNRKLPGVEVHANALSTLLRGDFISLQPLGWLILSVLVLVFSAMLLTKLLKPFRGLFAVLGVMLLYLVVALFAFLQQMVWVEITTPMIAIALSYVGNVLHHTLTEQRERMRIRKSWQQYMAKSVIDSMLDSGDLPKYGGERRELTVLFSDIRSFTNFSEKHTSHEVVDKLREYLTEMVDVIFENSGTLDKFVGDEIMAVYGAPHYYEAHAEKACQSAVQMIERLKLLQQKWIEKGEDVFNIGIGINSGKVIAGNLGSSQVFDYTVIGDDVNLGARLEGANKQYGTTIIISEATYKAVRRKARVRELDFVRVKGKKKPVKIYELLSMNSLPKGEQKLIVDTFTRGLAYYKKHNWYQALTEFKGILKEFPNDGPTRVYITRCLDFIENPPPDQWDGVYDFTTK